MKYQFLRFQELTSQQVYDLLQLRSEVFVLEQACAYQDIDGLDDQAIHVLGEGTVDLLAYARIFPPKNNRVSIGRVVVNQNGRSSGVGRELMLKCLDYCQTKFPQAEIEISAQTYLTDFYQRLGFKNTGSFYLEDNIPHQTMIYCP